MKAYRCTHIFPIPTQFLAPMDCLKNPAQYNADYPFVMSAGIALVD
jgi:hypothetical protein